MSNDRLFRGMTASMLAGLLVGGGIVHALEHAIEGEEDAEAPQDRHSIVDDLANCGVGGGTLSPSEQDNQQSSL